MTGYWKRRRLDKAADLYIAASYFFAGNAALVQKIGPRLEQLGVTLEEAARHANVRASRHANTFLPGFDEPPPGYHA